MEPFGRPGGFRVFKGSAMVPVEYIQEQALMVAHLPYKLIARATLRCLGVPVPKTRVGHASRGVPTPADGDIIDCMANAASPMDGRHG